MNLLGILTEHGWGVTYVIICVPVGKKSTAENPHPYSDNIVFLSLYNVSLPWDHDCHVKLRYNCIKMVGNLGWIFTWESPDSSPTWNERLSTSPYMILFCKQITRTNKESCNLLHRITLCKKRWLGHKDGGLMTDTFHRISMKICIFLYFLVFFLQDHQSKLAMWKEERVPSPNKESVRGLWFCSF